MAPINSIPPGRSGRMWLRRRIGTAEQGSDQLDRKLRILVSEQHRLRLRAQHLRRDFENAYQVGSSWLLRASLLGGQDALRAFSPAPTVSTEISWTEATGLTYPSDAVLSDQPTAPGPAGNAAVEPAAAAFRAALLAAIRTAAAEEAVRRVEAEITLTRRRLRALEKRWLPSLRDALAHLELALEQAEQEDAIRLRRAGGTTSDRRPQ